MSPRADTRRRWRSATLAALALALGGSALTLGGPAVATQPAGAAAGHPFRAGATSPVAHDAERAGPVSSRWYRTKVGATVRTKAFTGAAHFAFTAKKGTLLRLERGGRSAPHSLFHLLPGRRYGAPVRIDRDVHKIRRTGRYVFVARTWPGVRFDLLRIERASLGTAGLSLPVRRGTSYEVAVTVPASGAWAARVSGAPNSAWSEAYTGTGRSRMGNSRPSAIAFVEGMEPLYVDRSDADPTAANGRLADFGGPVAPGTRYWLTTRGGTATLEPAEAGPATPDSPATSSQTTSGLFVHDLATAPGEFVHPTFPGASRVPFGSRLVGTQELVVPGLFRATQNTHRMVTLTAHRPGPGLAYRVLRPSLVPVTVPGTAGPRSVVTLGSTEPGRWVVAPLSSPTLDPLVTYPQALGGSWPGWLAVARPLFRPDCVTGNAPDCDTAGGGHLFVDNTYLPGGLDVTGSASPPTAYVVIPFAPTTAGSLQISFGPPLPKSAIPTRSIHANSHHPGARP